MKKKKEKKGERKLSKKGKCKQTNSKNKKKIKTNFCCHRLGNTVPI